VNAEKRGPLTRMARQFVRTRKMNSASCRFDMLAIETSADTGPEIRLPKGAFIPEQMIAARSRNC
jgi:Holliday junction resolvase-like predicted endonuclease